jgi:predicted ATPase/DNA-binding SARP family transcriptional activator
MPAENQSRHDELFRHVAVTSSQRPTDVLHVRPLGSVPTSLPFLLSSFVGRERELAEIKRRLATHRLLTLTGPGGCGKTRLALEAAADLVAHFENRVWVVELAALADPALVPQVVTSTLGVREQQERNLTETLADAIGSTRMLFLLDNCEHVIDACATLTHSLLRLCPHLHILATSREALHIDGEMVWLVPSLSLPGQEPLPPFERLEEYDAVRLFIERAADIISTFTLTPQNAPAVVGICQRLDGIPLAIELATARMRILSAEQLAERLDDCFRLLTEGSRMALPRQQTLRATIDWSYHLMSEPERTLFHRLSVFAGGFTLEAAEVVCAGAGLEQDDVLDLLSPLVNKSLVAVVEQGDVTRYRLLETVRQYAWEKLHFAGEAAAMQRQHAGFFLALAEAAEPHLRSAERRAWLDRLEKEHDNLRAVLERARASAGMEGMQGLERGLHLAGTLFWFWYFRGYVSEARHWFEGLLALTPSSKGIQARAAALFGAGTMAWVQGDHVIAHAYLNEGVALWRELGNQRGLAYSLTFLGLVTGLQSDHIMARLLQEESSMLFREIGDMWGLALSLYWLGAILRRQGDYTAASAAFEESLAIFRKVEDTWGLSLALQSLGVVAYRQGDYVTACSQLEEGLTLGREVGDKWDIAHVLNSLGVVVQRQGDCRRATALFEESLILHQEVGDTLGMAFSLRNLGSLAQQQGDYARAVALFKERLLILRERGHTQHIAECLLELGNVVAAQGYLVRALRLFGATERLSEAVGVHISPADHDWKVNAVRMQLNEEVSASAWAEGRTMTMEQAIDYALAEPSSAELTPPREVPVHLTLAQTPSVSFETHAVPVLRLFALGPGRVYRGETALTSSEWTYAKVKELLFYLLCYRSRTKEQIGLALWPDASSAQLRGNLHNTLYHLRRTLGKPEWIVFEQGNYAFNRQLAYWFDVEVYKSFVAQALQLQTEEPLQAISVLEEATKLSQGDFLEDFVMGDWSILQRDELRRMHQETLLTLGRLYFAEGRYVRAAEAYRQVLAHDNYLEVAHRELMRCYVRLGERGQAVRHYQNLVAWMRRELGSPPTVETQALFERLRRGEDS